jgi:hypothetical protein
MNNKINNSYININIQDRIYQYEKKIYISRIAHFIEKCNNTTWFINTLTASTSDIKKDNKYILLVEMWLYIYNNICYFTRGNFCKFNEVIYNKIQEFKQHYVYRRSDLNELFDVLRDVEKFIHIYSRHKCYIKTITGCMCNNKVKKTGCICTLHTNFFKYRYDLLVSYIDKDSTSVIMDYLID